MGKQQKPRRAFQKKQSKRSQQEAEEIDALERALAEQAPAQGTNPLLQASAGEGASMAGAKKFEELPLSKYTKEGLREAKFVSMTAIQRAALPHSLAGRDVLGAAKTGSGKTLAFLIPVRRKACVCMGLWEGGLCCGTRQQVSGQPRPACLLSWCVIPRILLHCVIHPGAGQPQVHNPHPSPVTSLHYSLSNVDRWWRSCTARGGQSMMGWGPLSSRPPASWRCRCASASAWRGQG